MVFWNIQKFLSKTHNGKKMLELLERSVLREIRKEYKGVFDGEKREVFIPNHEISGEFVNAVKGAGWSGVFDAVKRSEELLRATWERKEELVAEGIGAVHMETQEA